MNYLIAPIAIAVLASLFCLTSTVGSEDDAGPKDPMAEMMKKIEEARKTGPQHEKMKYFLGDWTVAVDMMGMKSTGTAKFDWVIDGRWMGHHLKTTMMGREVHGFGVGGYDMYSKSYVTMFVSDNDTALNVSRGPKVDPNDKMIVEYGVLREYLTGELDKPYKVVKKRVDEDNFTVDIWDMGIGESGKVVVAYKYTRVKK